MNITILLADDHKLMREGLRTLIAEQPGMSVVGEAVDGNSAVLLAATLLPDVIIMDISMPGLNGIEATRRITAAGTSAKIIALSMHLESRMVLEMLNAGATGYLLKDCAFDEVICAIQAVVANRAYLSHRVGDAVLKDYVLRAPADELPDAADLSTKGRELLQLMVEGRGTREIASLLHVRMKTAENRQQEIMLKHIAPCLHLAGSNKHLRLLSLSSREKEIMLWIKDGKSDWDISNILGISLHTVKFHMKNVFRKLNATRRSQAITVAIENNLLDR